MLWLTWRQHRIQLAAAAGLVGALAVFLAITQAQMSGALHGSALAACLDTHGDCALLAGAFRTRFGTLLTLVAYLQLLPMLAGLFWGAPLLAREYELGTFRLAWTQAITPRRWLLVKLACLSIAVIAAGLILTGLLSWWLHPFTRIGDINRMQPDEFSLQGIAPIAYALYAFALGVAAGAFARRVLPAMAATLAGYLALRIPLADRRGSLIAPLHLTYPAGSPSPRASAGDLILPASGWTGPTGRPLTGGDLDRICGSPALPSFHGCLATHGILRADVYQPISRFWALQLAESGIYLGLAVILVAVACWWILRRTA